MKRLTGKKDSGSKINPRAMHQEYLNRIEKDLTDAGVVFFDTDTRLNIDDDYLCLPKEITEVPSRQLGEYLNAFTQQKIYLRTLLGRVELLVEDAKRKYMEVSYPFYMQVSSTKKSETAKEREVNSNPQVQPYYDDYMDYKRKQTLVEYSINNVEDIIFLISREVTRRTGDFNEENRNYNVNKR